MAAIHAFSCISSPYAYKKIGRHKFALRHFCQPFFVEAEAFTGCRFNRGRKPHNTRSTNLPA